MPRGPEIESTWSLHCSLKMIENVKNHWTTRGGQRISQSASQSQVVSEDWILNLSYTVFLTLSRYFVCAIPFAEIAISHNLDISIPTTQTPVMCVTTYWLKIRNLSGFEASVIGAQTIKSSRDLRGYKCTRLHNISAHSSWYIFTTSTNVSTLRERRLCKSYVI